MNRRDWVSFVPDLAARLLADFDSHHPGTCFGQSGFALTVDEAYELQNAVARLRQQRGEMIAGYKVGCVSETMQRQLGLDRPVFGHVWENEVYSSEATIDANCFDGLAIEGELAFRLADDVPSADWLMRNSDVLAEAYVVIELHNYVFRAGPGQAAAELIANNAIHAGVVLPASATPWDPTVSSRDVIIRVAKNDERLGAESLERLPGGPLASAVRLAEHLTRWNTTLLRGQLILTGSPLPLWRVAPGDRIHVECPYLKQRVAAAIT